MSDSTTSSQLQRQCSICLDNIDAAVRSTARLACGHFFHLDCIGSEFNYRRLMQCPNCRLVEEGEWLFAAGGFQQAIVTDDLDLEDDEDIEEEDNDDDYFDLSPSMQMYLMQNRLPFPGIGLPPLNIYPMVPVSSVPAYRSAGTQAEQSLLVAQRQHGLVTNNSVSVTVANSEGYNGLAHDRNFVEVRQNLGRPVHPHPGYGQKETIASVIELISNSNTPPTYCCITNPQGQAAAGQVCHTCPGPMIHGWPAFLHSGVAQQPQRPAVSRPVPTADAEGLYSPFFARRVNYARHINLDASTYAGQAAQPPPENAGNVRHSPQHVTGQRMRDRHQREPSTSTEEDAVNMPFRFL